MSSTNDQLRILSVCHYVAGGFHILFGCFGLIYVGMGAMMLSVPQMMHNTQHPGNEMPLFFPWIFILMGGMWVLFGWGLGIATILSGRFMVARKYRIFSIVVGAVNCMLVPFGTVLGIFDLILLMREDVRAQYPG